MSAKDKQRLAIAIALAVVVLAALWYFVLRKPKAGEEIAQAPAALAPGSRAGLKSSGKAPLSGGAPAAKPGAIPGPAAPGLAARPGAPAGAPVPGAAGAVAAAVAPGATPAAGAPGAPVKATPLYPARPDPFAPLIKPRPYVPPPPPPPPPAVVQVGIPLVTAQTLPPQVLMVEEQRVSPGRTSGVMWNDRVYAILEKPDNTSTVLQPGDTVNGDTVRAISPQGIVLARKGGGEIPVPLRARGSGAAPATAAPAQPELPGAPSARAY
jgi:hypothetical protein